MARILSIDDEPLYCRLISMALTPLGHEVVVAHNGARGLEFADANEPDLIITDVMMPELNGYEVIRQLRRDPRFAHTPILTLTSQSDLQDKIQSFEAGADDHVTKPFEVDELVVRVNALLRRVETAKAAQAAQAELAAQRQASASVEQARLIVVHSLRGGTGSSTTAVNLSLALAGLWDAPTLLLDLVLMAGQVALMLNWSLKRTWADIAHVDPAELDFELLRSIITRHESGLYFVSAPTYPSEAETLKPAWLEATLRVVKPQYEYIVADLPHDFSDIALQALDVADVILVMLAPEMSSIRAAAAALDTYARLEYPKEKIRLVLNNTFPRGGIPREKIEAALNTQVSMTIPYLQDRFVEAINRGQPPMYAQPEEPTSALIEDYAFLLSKDRHKKVKPEAPTAGWKRVYKRFAQRRK
jgi:pilus assembly protein CpaE